MEVELWRQREVNCRLPASAHTVAEVSENERPSSHELLPLPAVLSLEMHTQAIRFPDQIQLAEALLSKRQALLLAAAGLHRTGERAGKRATDARGVRPEGLDVRSVGIRVREAGGFRRAKGQRLPFQPSPAVAAATRGPRGVPAAARGGRRAA